MTDRRPRVLVLTTRCPDVSGDCTPSFVLDNALALSDGFDITVLAPRLTGAPSVRAHGGVTVRRFAYLPRRWESLADDAIMPQLRLRPVLWLQAVALVVAMGRAARREVRAIGADLVHAQWVLPAGGIALALRRLGSTPYVVTARGGDAFLLDGAVLRRVKRAVLRRASRVVAVSQEIAARLPAADVPIEVLPSGVDFALWERLSGPRVPDPATVLFVGRLAAKKGVADAVRAVAALPDIRLKIVGDGPERSALGAVADELGAGDRVSFVGALDRTAIAAEFRTATCVVIPSVTAPDGDRDGTPNVFGEAVAAGVPVIASRIGGLAELIDDGRTGLLHAPGDVDGLRGHIRTIVLDPSLGEALAVAAHRELRDRLDLPRVASRYAEWYRDAVAGVSSR